MDTLTQALLGGAVGYAVAGGKAPRKAMLAGAAIAVLPDLDVFLQYSHDLDSMTHHRSWSHSWLVQTLVAPLIAVFLSRLDKQINFRHWWLLTWLALITHSGLDALTVYGTQIFWPFMPSPASVGSIFIIDPLYSIPLLAGFLWILIKPYARVSHRIMLGSLIFSCIYLGWGIAAQQWIKAQSLMALAKQSIEFSHFQVSAAPLNTLLWRVVVMGDDAYYEGFRSLFDGDAAFTFSEYPRGKALQNQLADSVKLQQINWFTNGLFKLEQQGNSIIASDLRMGMEPDYFFRFQLAEIHSGEIKLMPPKQLPTQRNAREGLQIIWLRIWDPAASPESQSTDSFQNKKL